MICFWLWAVRAETNALGGNLTNSIALIWKELRGIWREPMLMREEVVDTVYVELYGTRVVDGERVSKFATYSGRGSLRGWLRTVIWHSLVDLHRASHDEVSLDEMTENVGEGHAHSNFAETDLGGEDRDGRSHCQTAIPQSDAFCDRKSLCRSGRSRKTSSALLSR